ncbi:MAG: TIGR00300 family protein [Thaumarchaeota archaeon]|jgi:lysine-ketoglutarate reductase/saccharopine dehydrogenase-like protein (TIGR00300 family)|nr:TIGR00300 family protein [Nitrososphaerota archaeon]MBT5842647.1 TIGR00300 family protein [Nitrososphaerota archaeon]MBT6468177.1 TIGR00300 family protein [Nitrososphaerota archaeon]
MGKFSQEIEVSGHLIDSLILTKIFDKIMDLKGEFQVQEINIGKKKKEQSYARLLVDGKNQEHLDKILETIYREGAVSKTQKNVLLKKSPKNYVMPDNFYSTTNNHTQVYYKNKWIQVENMMMDKCIVVKGKRAFCVPVRDVKKGDLVIVGENGVKITPPERPREGVNVFEFMNSSSSSERPTQHIAKKVAEDIVNTKKKGGKIVIVGGPAIVHTGASDSVSELIKSGYIDGVLAGNALAVHDIEYATLGTSLGMNVKDATLAYQGHRNHMDTINAVFKAGSITNMVKTKKLTKGIMYECVKNKIPFVLAGSIRDDGPLPDVITDVAQAQREYKKVLKDASMVIMISTMLHSIATGNMLPANVKVIVVDINQPTVTKLMDRGTWQALGIVSDVGAFLPMVAQQIRKKK